MSLQSEFYALAREGGRGAIVTLLEGGPGPAGAKLLVRADGTADGTLGDPELDRAVTAMGEELMWEERSERRMAGEAAVFLDVAHPAPRLITFGAVDFAAQLCVVARASGWRPFVVDPRGFFARQDRFPAAEQVVAGWPEEAIARLGGIDRATAMAVLTHDPKLDDAALSVALRSEAFYIGAMGSRRAQAKRRERLLGLGFTDADLERLSAPIGLDLGAQRAEETALSIMAEIVAVRHGREGGRLIDAAGRIHQVGS